MPIIRGEMDPQIDKHETVEHLISQDLDHWLCNLYLEIVKLPRCVKFVIFYLIWFSVLVIIAGSLLINV